VRGRRTLFDINHVAERMLGYGARAPRRPFRPSSRGAVARVRLWRSALEARHASRDDLHLLTRRGELVPVFANAGYIEYGPRRWVQLICVDISDRKRWRASYPVREDGGHRASSPPASRTSCATRSPS